MREILKRIGRSLRAVGFRGSGQNYRKTDGEFIFVVNFQRISVGDHFYVNLGAQPTFIPAEGDSDLDRLKEVECVFRKRAGGWWPRQMSEAEAASFEAEVLATQQKFFDLIRQLPAALMTDPVEVLIEKYASASATHNAPPHAILNLARAASARGSREKARQLAICGLELAAERNVILIAELRELLASLEA
jgi:hypothetical protein